MALTSPMVGNYGVPNPATMDAYGLPEFFESSRIHAAALLVQDYSLHYSHWNAHMSLGDWLKQEASLYLTFENTRHPTFKLTEQVLLFCSVESILTILHCIHSPAGRSWFNGP